MTHVICSDHFEDNCFNNPLDRDTSSLKRYVAVPTLNLTNAKTSVVPQEPIQQCDIPSTSAPMDHEIPVPELEVIAVDPWARKSNVDLHSKLKKTSDALANLKRRHARCKSVKRNHKSVSIDMQHLSH